MTVSVRHKLPAAATPRFSQDVRALADEQVFIVDGTDHTFTNGWTNYDTATHNGAGAIKQGGRVYLEGVIKSGTSGFSAFTLPSAFRPGKPVELAANANGLFGAVVVGMDGTVTVTGETTKFSLEGVSFRAA